MSGGSNLKIVDRGVEYRSRSPTCTEQIIRLINHQRPVRAAGRARCEVIHHIRTKRAIIPSDFRQALEDAQYTEGDYARRMGSYYDVDAILTDAQKVPCTFELTVPGLGYLEGNMSGDMKQGSKVELPLWLGEMLALSQSLNTSSLVTIDPPSALSPRVLNALKADPRTVDLRALAPHFYNLGARILELFEEEEMIEVLSDTFKARAALIADQAHNPRGALGEGADFMRGLDENERQLFRAAHDSAKGVRTWMADLKKK